MNLDIEGGLVDLPEEDRELAKSLFRALGLFKDGGGLSKEELMREFIKELSSEEEE